MKQATLFEDRPTPIPVNVTVHPAEAPRLSAQSAQILALLEDGPVEAGRLVAIARKYTSRISEVRVFVKQRGQDVENFARNYKTGESWYRLVRLP